MRARPKHPNSFSRKSELVDFNQARRKLFKGTQTFRTLPLTSQPMPVSVMLRKTTLKRVMIVCETEMDGNA
jgi:hypothetical protein